MNKNTNDIDSLFFLLKEMHYKLNASNIDDYYKILFNIQKQIDKNQLNSMHGLLKLEELAIFLISEGVVSIGILAKWFNLDYATFYFHIKKHLK